jgi:NADH:ubiquinone oxidoreductase subunit D
MKNRPFKIDDSLIISRLQQKELLDIKPNMAFDSCFFPLVTKIFLKPFFDNLPIKLGMELQLIGNAIIHTRIDRGYFYHGFEELLTGLSPHNAVLAMVRLERTLPIFYQLALMITLEDLTDWPKNSLFAKQSAIALEIARVAHHLNVIKNVLYCLDLSSISELLIECEHLLTKPINSFCQVYSEVTLLGENLSREEIRRILLEVQIIMDSITSRISLQEKLFKRLIKKAIVNLPMASSMGLTGLYLRANRNHYDLRQKSIIYKTAPNICLTEGGDAWARFVLRLLEIDASLKWLKHTLSGYEKEFNELKSITIQEDYCQKQPSKKFAFGEIEGPEGDIKVSIFVNNKDNSLLFRVRTPAYFIAQAIPYLLTQTDLRDIPVMLHSLGISAEEVDK